MSFFTPFPNFHNQSFGHGYSFHLFLTMFANLVTRYPDYQGNLFPPNSTAGHLHELYAACDTLQRWFSDAMVQQALGHTITITLHDEHFDQSTITYGDRCARQGCGMAHIRLTWKDPDMATPNTIVFDVPTSILQTQHFPPRAMNYRRLPGDCTRDLDATTAAGIPATELFRYNLPSHRAARDLLTGPDPEGPWLRLVRRTEAAVAATVHDANLDRLLQNTGEAVNALILSSPRRVPERRIDLVLWWWLARQEALLNERNRRASRLRRAISQALQVAASNRTQRVIDGFLEAPIVYDTHVINTSDERISFDHVHRPQRDAATQTEASYPVIPTIHLGPGSPPPATSSNAATPMLEDSSRESSVQPPTRETAPRYVLTVHTEMSEDSEDSGNEADEGESPEEGEIRIRTNTRVLIQGQDTPYSPVFVPSPTPTYTNDNDDDLYHTPANDEDVPRVPGGL
ncbi:hypothetical protein BDY19DRAFT_998986 [Irpex rosettiformis]|uniref:Uncharacterized protein n=1 Tax=Irpex rosettiformis TaxID=378272 RepID=A0ACB8TLZ7_9APHY|nr:hypothetical protein BDY19DRAFT_998986 [Irpex rosettiformis]